ncbi:OmpH family outer membrane protein [Vibrio europaeus]|uniref:Chaperone protein skp n=1 Tax=Vibrio europaeus TaxID=300876 RepID=A0A178JH54_9VIBR|nr:OmpH family outer membrane protein [Vibrio europaeus]MDC5704334.1 OmpH family outer membrane protein [Vibrio europaeus]MDC5708964.1 OmpH family outer membrane protein [Vibrio europaeus]MDC5717696.1 OmpH family outer membrane protein [Vibrio europaeus]MDC5718765.1 OmpH family outer membrane protein [Vibrio europaeus]MDC5727803.1 OmpH family outer membrane protein [Vibrio europaeus]
MNKTIKAAGLGLLVMTSSFFANAAEAAQKIGYVNTAQVFQALPQREVVAQKLQDEFKDKSSELQAIQAKGKSKVEKLKRDGELMSQEDIDNLRLEIGQLENELKLKAQSFEKLRQRRQAEEEQKLFKTIQDAINKVAEKKGFDMVLEQQAVRFSKPENDISKAVIDSLK